MQAGWWTDDEIKINQNYGVILEKIYVINSSFPYLPPRIKETWSVPPSSSPRRDNSPHTTAVVQCCRYDLLSAIMLINCPH